MAVKEVGELDYHNINVKMTDGTIFATKSCWGHEGDTLVLDIDPLIHPAWKTDNKNYLNSRDDQITKFKKKFSGFKF
ncbi:MAG: hypothetical protein Ta2D_11860 [Rickettsiales bacterium]|nr:MAG: hypothetical protein Ta2D_11860 [Rickettsiales bacterium]